MMPSTALKRARSTGSRIAARIVWYPSRRKNRNSVRVSRPSHVHHAPQMGLAQIGPVVSITPQNTVATSALAAAKRSSRRSRSHRYRMLTRPVSTTASIAHQADGAWT